MNCYQNLLLGCSCDLFKLQECFILDLVWVFHLARSKSAEGELHGNNYRFGWWMTEVEGNGLSHEPMHATLRSTFRLVSGWLRVSKVSHVTFSPSLTFYSFEFDTSASMSVPSIRRQRLFDVRGQRHDVVGPTGDDDDDNGRRHLGQAAQQCNKNSGWPQTVKPFPASI